MNVPLQNFLATIEALAHLSPRNAFELALLLLIGLFLLTFAYIILRTAYVFLKIFLYDTLIAPRARPFSVAQSGGKRILIAGDSTAVGTGARTPEESIAGRLAHDYPSAQITNIAVNGARTHDVLRQFKKVAGGQFDIVLLSIGGNDIWRGSNLHGLTRDLVRVLTAAKALSGGRVLLLIYNNIGDAPIFPSFMKRSLRERGRKLHELFGSIAAQLNVPCIPLFTTSEDNPFLRDPKRLFAPDGIHPSGEGYRLWYNRLWRIMAERGYGAVWRSA